MISASTEFIRAMQDNHTFKVKIDCTLTDGTQLTIDNSNIRMDSLSFEKAISDDASFDIGSFIVGKLSFTLNNIPGTYNGMDFDGAVLVLSFANQLNGKLYPASNLYPGTNLYPGQISSQYVRIGTYTVVDTDGQNGAWISLVAYDNAYKFQVPLSDINMTFPMTASSLVSTICYATGVTCASRPASLNSITVQALPDGVEPNCLQALAWCAMMAGRNASIDASGRLYFPSYPKATLTSVQADIEANGWDNADLSAVNEITGLVNVRTMVEDVTITGVAVTYTDTDGEEATTAVSGTEGYVLNLSENAFVNESNVSAVVSNLNSAVVGMTFRPFEIAMMGNPLFEPGDVVWFENRKGQKFLSVLTSMSFTLGEHMTALCGAEAPEKQSSMGYSANTRVIQQAKAVARKALNTANSAAEVAEATAQYFWTDTNGVHVSSEANNATATRNTLWNSLGMLFRKGANALLGILTGNNPSVVIYDGLGNLDSNIVASFSANGVVIGLEDGIHSKMENDGFGIAYADDRLFDVSTNGFLTNIYMGGSTHAIGCQYTDVQVVQTLSFLEGCTVSGTSIIDPYGVATGYTLEYDSTAQLYHVLDASGYEFASASYAGIFYDAQIEKFEPDVRLEPLEEVPTAQVIISMGGIGVSAYDNVLDLDAETIKVSKKRTNGVVYGDINISEDEVSFGTYDSGSLWYRSSLSLVKDGQRGTFYFDSGAPYGGQIGIGNYDNAGHDLYTGMTNISSIGDGTITGAISALAPSVSYVNGSSASVSSGSATTIASITLKKGKYLLTGACRFSTNSSGYRTLLFSASGNSGSAFDRFAVERVGASQDNTTYMQLTWPVEITTTGTTIYLNATQNSGSALTVDSDGIKYVALDGGGRYAQG